VDLAINQLFKTYGFHLICKEILDIVVLSDIRVISTVVIPCILFYSMIVFYLWMSFISMDTQIQFLFCIEVLIRPNGLDWSAI